jgi:hypothetical protein
MKRSIYERDDPTVAEEVDAAGVARRRAAKRAREVLHGLNAVGPLGQVAEGELPDDRDEWAYALSEAHRVYAAAFDLWRSLAVLAVEEGQRPADVTRWADVSAAAIRQSRSFHETEIPLWQEIEDASAAFERRRAQREG